MMSGYLDCRVQPKPRPVRKYEVVARGGGWCIGINGAFTRPFPQKAAAKKIARRLQKQADSLAK